MTPAHPGGAPGTARWARLQVWAVAGLVVASACAGAASGSHPTWTPVVDPVLSGLLAGLVTAAGAVAGRGVLMTAAVVAVGMSRRWLWLPAAAALFAAVGHAGTGRRRPVPGALVAALVAQSLLRWPPAGFSGLPSLVATAVVAAVLISAGRSLPQTARRWAAAIAVGVAALAGVLTALVAVSMVEARTSLENGVSSARTALRQMESYQAPAAVANLEAATAQLDRARASVSAWWASGGAVVPVIAQQRRAVLNVTRAGTALASSAIVAARTVQDHNLDAGDGAFNLASVRALAGPVRDVAASLERTEAAVSGSRSRWLVPPLAQRLGQLDRELAGDVTTAKLVERGVEVAPSLLGESGARHYFVAFMTPAEARGLGGFVGAYAVVTIDRGKLSLTTSGRAPLLSPPPGAGARLTGPVDYVDRYSAFRPDQHFQDVSYSPDFPTVDQVISELYPQMEGGQAVDGVLLLDPDALQALLQFTGPISIAGVSQPLDSANAADILLRQQYLADTSAGSDQARHDLLQEALTTGFQRFMANSLPAPPDLFRALDPLVRQGRLLYWDSRPSVQPLLRQVGLAGGFPQPGPGADVLAVTLSNYDNNKIDAYLHETVHDTVSFDPRTGRVDATVSVGLRNDAPPAGLPDYVIGSFSGSGIPDGTAEEWVTLYTPFSVAGATFDGRPFQFGAPLPELGVLAYSGYVRVPAGGTGQLQVRLVGQLPAGTSYRMAVRMQPLANATPASVTLDLPAQWRPAAPWALTTDEVQNRIWVLKKAAPAGE